jgi:hypothetical protein
MLAIPERVRSPRPVPAPTPLRARLPPRCPPMSGGGGNGQDSGDRWGWGLQSSRSPAQLGGGRCTANPGEPRLGSHASFPPAPRRGGWSRHPRGRRGGRRQRLGTRRRQRRQKLGSALGWPLQPARTPSSSASGCRDAR